MEKEKMADFLEEFSEQLGVYYTHWLLDDPYGPDDANSFVGYCQRRVQEDLAAPRKGGSYLEVRK